MAAIGLIVIGCLIAYERLKDRRSPTLITDTSTPSGNPTHLSYRQLKRHLKRWQIREKSLQGVLRNPYIREDEERRGRVMLAEEEAQGMVEDLTQALQAVKKLDLKKGGLFKYVFSLSRLLELY